MGVYSLLPDISKLTPQRLKQQYINGHYCYAHKMGIMTNGIGIIRDISFFDDSFKSCIPIWYLRKAIIRILIRKSATLTHSNLYYRISLQFTAICRFLHFWVTVHSIRYDNYTMLKNDFSFQACLYSSEPP